MAFNRKDHEGVGEIRPRFKLLMTIDETESINRINEAIAKTDDVVGRKVHDQYYIDIPVEQRKLWSPELRISIDYNCIDHEGDLVLRVLVGPQASVWIGFMTIYVFLLLASFFGGLYGIAQWRLGSFSPWVYMSIVGFVLVAGIFIVSKIGQRSTRNQTLHLVSTLLHALGYENFKRVE